MGTIEVTLGFLGLVGIGGIITALITKRKELLFKVLENKERRYKSCLLYMDVYFKPENIKYLSSRQSDISSALDVIEYLKAEYHEMILYASKPVILSVKTFIETPNKTNFLSTVLAMRKDLWSKKDDFKINEIGLSETNN
ncbi:MULTISPECIES: hypothetical protein [unclassified Pseudomonas]|uniref:hypothetical protein n=1 Tax=unclassified Pseudomonas TaxID=196821 RepID=UPI00119B3BF2|nr:MULTISPECIES: hypothetical protein [unclassified Pseudomonas]TWC13457.1 hypothetical protein FBY05_12626 [Pseudomonas sp. SJZ083]TWC42769.1 hypothetical protein FBY01_12626 [Pseudomonas sp. SJZ077]TWC60058.1 hypothetical protein FBY04_102347 [Pseudomonas sp. SJZ080]